MLGGAPREVGALVGIALAVALAFAARMASHSAAMTGFSASSLRHCSLTTWSFWYGTSGRPNLGA